jgi:hypothetical protein
VNTLWAHCTRSHFLSSGQELVNGLARGRPILEAPSLPDGVIQEQSGQSTYTRWRLVAHVVASGCRASDLNRLRHFSPSAFCIPLTLERTDTDRYWAQYWKNGRKWLFRLSVAGLCREAIHSGLTTSREQCPGLQFAMDRGAL